MRIPSLLLHPTDPHRWIDLDARWAVRWNRLSRYRVLRDLFRVVSRLGDGVVWYSLMLVLPALYGARAIPAVIQMLVAGIAGLAIYKWLKKRTLRPRPYEVVTDVVAACTPLDRFSFPSGHTLHAVNFSLIAAAHFPQLAPWLYGFAALVAASRPILGLHYPSDVLAGATIGALLASLAVGV